MTDYEQLASNMNNVAKSNISAGAEPMTIAARRNMANANQDIRLHGMDRQDIFKRIMELFQSQQNQKQSEASPLDFAGAAIQGAGSIYSGLKSRDLAQQQQDQMNSILSRYGS